MTQNTEPERPKTSDQIDRPFFARAPEGAPRRLRVLFAALLLGAAFAGGGVATCAYRALSPTELKLSSTTTELRGTRAVVTAMRNLAILETASYHMERVIDLRDRQSHLFGLFESQDAMLLVAAADVLAGVDLSSMRDGDIAFDRTKHSVRVLLPPPTVLSSHLDNEHTYVHSRSTDALALRAEALETRASQAAEHTLRDSAVEAGILQRARVNATSTVTTLLRRLGFDEVEVQFREE